MKFINKTNVHKNLFFPFIKKSPLSKIITETQNGKKNERNARIR